MKKKIAIRLSTIIIIISVPVCLVLAAVTLYRTMTRKSSVGADNANSLYRNVYIINSSDGSIRFLYGGSTIEYKGVLSEKYEGIADVEVTDGQITKIYAKPYSVNGTLDAFTDESICITGYGWVSCSETPACYCRQTDGTIVESDFSNTIVGVSTGDFIFESGTVCAFISDEAAAVSDIRVLLKNGESIFRDSLYLTATAQWYVSGAEINTDISSYTVDKSLNAEEIAGADTLLDMIGSAAVSDSESAIHDFDSDTGDSDSSTNATGSETGISICYIECPEGLLYLCDAGGSRLSEGYEGVLRILSTDNGYVLINELSLEDYVRFVLPSEMPSGFSYEALKAQAVCARTFACSQMQSNVYAPYGANLDDSTSYQVFNAFGTSDLMDQAVSDTAGQILTVDNELITCYYYSTSPGFTNTTDVWGNDDPTSWLTRKTTLLSQEISDLSAEKTFLDFITSSPESYDSDSPFYRWTAQLNLADISDSSLGTLEKISVVSRNESGYVTELSCIYEGGSTTLTNENVIRHVLGAGLSNLTLADGSSRDFATVPSACFAVTSENGSSVTLTGGGFGHGIGMSQYGADAMGDMGWTYEEILKFYYEGAQISSM